MYHQNRHLSAKVRAFTEWVAEMYERRRRELIQRHFGKLLSAGRKAGIVRKDVSPELLIEILLGAVQAIMNPPKMSELGLTPETGFSAILTVFLEGVITGRGRLK